MQLYKLLKDKPKERNVECIWYWGETGTGKTRTAVDKLGGVENLYMKASNKWWDGYQGEDNVLLDELDGASWIANFIKRWSDRYPCLLEYKGGTMNARYTRFYVTC